MVLYGNPVLYYYVPVVIDTTLVVPVQDYRTTVLGYFPLGTDRFWTSGANAKPVPTMLLPRVGLLVETHPPVPHLRGSTYGLGCFGCLTCHGIA